MKFLKTFTKWQFWASIALMAVLCFALYHFTFRVWLDSYTNHNEEIEIPDLSKMTIQQAIKTLDSLNLTYEIDSVRHDSTHPIYAVLDFYPAKGFKVKEGRRVFVKSNPKGWRPVQMPDIVGKSKRLAFTQLKLSGLEVGDTLYEPDIAKDAVLRVMFQGKQIVKGTELPRFAKVDLVLGKGLEYGVDMQNLIGMNLEQARSSIMANRFEVGRINFDGATADSSALKVYYQYPLPGDNYDQGLPVDLWVSAKSPQELQMAVKDLDRQYRNYSENDSIAAAKYREELDGNTVKPNPGSDAPVPATSGTDMPEQPDGISID